MPKAKNCSPRPPHPLFSVQYERPYSAKGFGLRGTNVTDLGQFASLLRDYQPKGTTEIWNIPISDQVTSPSMRRVKIKGHGVI